MSVSNCTGLAWKYSLHWNRKLLSLSGSVPLKVSGMRAFSSPRISVRCGSLISIKSVSKSAEYFSQLFVSIIALTGFDREQVEDVGLLVAKLVLGLVVGASSQLGSLSAGMIFGPRTGKAIWSGWIVLDGDLRDDQPLWWICLEYCGAFGG